MISNRLYSTFIFIGILLLNNNNSIKDLNGNKMHIYISTDKAKYQLQEPIILKVAICNNSTDCILEDRYIDFNINITDEKGNVIKSSYNALQAARSMDCKNFTIYKKGECYETKSNLIQTLAPKSFHDYRPWYDIFNYGKYNIKVNLSDARDDKDIYERCKNRFVCNDVSLKKSMIFSRPAESNKISILVMGGVFEPPTSLGDCPTKSIKVEVSPEYFPAGTQSGSMIYIPSGPFMMGIHPAAAYLESIKYDEKSYFYYFLNQGPPHKVYLDGYYIDKYEVTQGEYEECFKAGRCQENEKYDGFTDLSQPVVGVNWYDARNYCEFVGKRLPTEAEWEKAARGTDCRLYPWGNEFDGTRLNFWDMKDVDKDSWPQEWKDGYKKTAPVGSYPLGSSPYGAFDMSGNVSEWCQDWMDKYEDGYIENPHGSSSGNRRVARGNNFNYQLYTSLTTFRGYDGVWFPDKRYNDVGFRCAQSE